MLRKLARSLASLALTSGPRWEASIADAAKAAVGAGIVTAGHLVWTALGYLLWGLGRADPEPLSHALLLGASWLVLHFLALTASGPKGPDDRACQS